MYYLVVCQQCPAIRAVNHAYLGQYYWAVGTLSPFQLANYTSPRHIMCHSVNLGWKSGPWGTAVPVQAMHKVHFILHSTQNKPGHVLFNPIITNILYVINQTCTMFNP